MNKRILAIVLCVLMLVPAMGTLSTHAEDRVKITLASFPDQPKAALEKAIAAANLDFDVEIIEYPQSEYESKIKMAFSSETPTDLVLMDGPNIASYASTGKIEPLDAYWDKEDFADLVPCSQSAMQWDGHIWAAPLNESNTVLYYNKKVFDELGIQAPTKVDEAWTFQQLMDACEKVVQKDAAGNITRYAIQPQMFPMSQKNEGMTYTEQLWVWMAGGDFISADGKTATGVFDSKEAKAGLQFYADLYSKGYAATEDIANAFETGKVAMWVNGPWMLGVWKTQFPDFYEGSWGAMPLPRDAQGASGSGSWNIAISAQSAHKEQAWKAVQAITGKEGAKIWCSETGNLPARASVLATDPTYQEYPYNIINEQLQKTAHARPVTPQYPAISEAIMNCFADVAFGETVDKAVETAVKKMNTALAQ